MILRRGIDIVINSKGYFKETKKPVFYEALLNLIISLLFIKPLGINGVLMGSIFATLFTTFIFHPIFIYKNVFKKNVIIFYLRSLIGFTISILLAFLTSLIKINISGVGSFILNVILYSVVVLTVLFTLFYLIFKPMRNLTIRAKDLILNILKTRRKDER